MTRPRALFLALHADSKSNRYTPHSAPNRPIWDRFVDGRFERGQPGQRRTIAAGRLQPQFQIAWTITPLKAGSISSPA